MNRAFDELVALYSDKRKLLQRLLDKTERELRSGNDVEIIHSNIQYILDVHEFLMLVELIKALVFEDVVCCQKFSGYQYDFLFPDNIKYCVSR